MIIEMCKYYTVKHVGYWGSSYDRFGPCCRKGHKASLKCHSHYPKCPDYTPEVNENYEALNPIPNNLP